VSAPASPSPAHTVRSSGRRRLFVAGAIAAGLLPFLGVELALRAAGVAREVSYQDPLVGFSRVSPLFELSESGDVYRTARTHQIVFDVNEFPARKGNQTHRTFVLGGSTVRGRPYTNDTAFARWMQLELAARHLNRTFEVINCGGESYASYRLTNVLQEVLRYEPDLVVLATGHNEFLEDRTYADIKQRSPAWAWLQDRLLGLRTVRVVRAWARGTKQKATGRSADAERPTRPNQSGERTVLPDIVDTRLDHANGYGSYHRDDQWTGRVVAHFGRSVRAMIGMCREARVPIVLVVLGSNVRDCPPFKSEHRPGLTADEQQRWQAAFDAGAHAEADDPQAALAAYLAAAGIDDEYALLRFRIGRCLDRLDRSREAAGHLLAAKDLDVCPLRMREDMTALLRQIAFDTSTPFVDARQLIDSLSPQRIPGNDWYLDHVHPTLAAHQQIAAALVEALAAHSDLTGPATWSEADRRRAWRDHLRTLDADYLIAGHHRVGWLENWAQRQRLFDDTLPRSPEAHLRYAHRLWDFARTREAWDHYRAAMGGRPELSETLLARVRDLVAQGRVVEADELLSGLPDIAAAAFDEGRLRTLREEVDREQPESDPAGP
jgi:hypothetical protein